MGKGWSESKRKTISLLTQSAPNWARKGLPSFCLPVFWPNTWCSYWSSSSLMKVWALLSLRPRCCRQWLPYSLSHEEVELLHRFSLISDSIEKDLGAGKDLGSRLKQSESICIYASVEVFQGIIFRDIFLYIIIFLLLFKYSFLPSPPTLAQSPSNSHIFRKY